MDLLEKAIFIASKAHSGQKDKAGKAYIFHPLRVMLTLTDDKDSIVGVLHDVIEDTEITYATLLEEGFDIEVIEAIKSVTRQVGETYTEFIKRAKLNDIGRRVKIADLRDNMNISRIPNPTKQDYKRLEKYKKALEILLDE